MNLRKSWPAPCAKRAILNPAPSVSARAATIAWRNIWPAPSPSASSPSPSQRLCPSLILASGAARSGSIGDLIGVDTVRARLIDAQQHKLGTEELQLFE